MLNRAGGALLARANPHNLKGFLDAFKADPAPWGEVRRSKSRALTHREEFA
jgi:hypothetical protein